jgi:hypothetical protein
MTGQTLSLLPSVYRLSIPIHPGSKKLLAHVGMMLFLLQANDLGIGHGYHLDKAMNIARFETMALGG